MQLGFAVASINLQKWVLWDNLHAPKSLSSSETDWQIRHNLSAHR
jgi:hypothetical protein